MKKRAKSISLVRYEGTKGAAVKVTATTWEGANDILREWARTAPDDGSYHKVSFFVTFEDGFEYKGRLDLQRKHHQEHYILQDRIITALNFFASGQWDSYRKGASDEAKEILEKYQIG